MVKDLTIRRIVQNAARQGFADYLPLDGEMGVPHNVVSSVPLE